VIGALAVDEWAIGAVIACQSLTKPGKKYFKQILYINGKRG